HLAVLLAAVLAVVTLLPLRSFAANLPCEEWEGSFEAIIPAGDAPWAKIRLTPTGAEFTEWYLPTEYEVVCKDGSRWTVSVETWEETIIDGYNPRICCNFEAEINGKSITFFAGLMFMESAQSCRFDVGHTGTATDKNGRTMNFEHSVYVGECNTEIDQGDVFNYIAHKINYFLWNIKNYFENLYNRVRY
ncbi:MAG: hypothetical protein IJK98_03595, partial [Clostridia bacterium]|nr:hypothetical protein [Clostridia bacterium]